MQKEISPFKSGVQPTQTPAFMMNPLWHDEQANEPENEHVLQPFYPPLFSSLHL
jgi:hypothetical protein